MLAEIINRVLIIILVLSALNVINHLWNACVLLYFNYKRGGENVYEISDVSLFLFFLSVSFMISSCVHGLTI